MKSIRLLLAAAAFLLFPDGYKEAEAHAHRFQYAGLEENQCQNKQKCTEDDMFSGWVCNENGEKPFDSRCSIKCAGEKEGKCSSLNECLFKCDGEERDFSACDTKGKGYYNDCSIKCYGEKRGGVCDPVQGSVPHFRPVAFVDTSHMNSFKPPPDFEERLKSSTTTTTEKIGKAEENQGKNEVECTKDDWKSGWVCNENGEKPFVTRCHLKCSGEKEGKCSSLNECLFKCDKEEQDFRACDTKGRSYYNECSIKCYGEKRGGGCDPGQKGVPHIRPYVSPYVDSYAPPTDYEICLNPILKMKKFG